MTLHRPLIHLILPLVFRFVMEGDLYFLIAYDFCCFMNSLRKAYCLISCYAHALVRALLGYPQVHRLVDSFHHQTDSVSECSMHSEICLLAGHPHHQSLIQDFSFLSFSLDPSCSDERLSFASFPYYQYNLLMRNLEGNIGFHPVI